MEQSGFIDILRIIQALTTRIQVLETMNLGAKPKSTMFDYVTRRDMGATTKIDLYVVN